MLKRFSLLIILSLCWVPCRAGVSEIELAEVVSGLNRPLFLTHAGDGSGLIFIVEQGGRVRILENGSLLGAPFLDISSGFNLATAGERGFLGLAFHPDYSSNGRFFINYTRSVPQLQTVIQEHQVSADPNIADPSGQILLSFDQPFGNHNGGWLGFGPSDGYLYVTTGDGGSGGDPLERAQDLSTPLGKILRIDIDSGFPYGIPGSNPFVDVLGARQEIWAYGLRNPWRASFDSPSGRLFVADVGQSTWEEVDVVETGKNYGWDVVEGPECFEPAVGCDTTGLETPIHSYGRSLGVTVTGGYVYRGQQISSLVGEYVFGDYGSGRIWTLTEGPGGWSRSELFDTSLSISSFGVDEDGELYVVNHGGSIWKLTTSIVPPTTSSSTTSSTTSTTSSTTSTTITSTTTSTTSSTTSITSSTTSTILSTTSTTSTVPSTTSTTSSTTTIPISTTSTTSSTVSSTSSTTSTMAPSTSTTTSTISSSTSTTSSTTSSTSCTTSVTTSTVPPVVYRQYYGQIATGPGIITDFTFLRFAGNTPVTGPGSVLEGTSTTASAQLVVHDGTGSVRSVMPFPELPDGGRHEIGLSETPDIRTGWAQLDSEVALEGWATYTIRSEGKLITKVSVPGVSPGTSIALPVVYDAAQRTDTGFAVANPDDENLTLTLLLFDERGFPVGTVNLLLLAERQGAWFVSDFFLAQLGQSFQGKLEIRSGSPVVAIGLLSKGNVFSSIPMVVRE